MTVKKKRELSDVTITHVSYVERGANKRTFLFGKDEDAEFISDNQFEMQVRVIRKADDPQRILCGIVYEPDEVDTHGDFMTAEQIEKSAHEFLARYRQVDSDHNLIPGAGVVAESYIARCDQEIGGQTVKKGTWILVTKATDEIWERYLDGSITGYSMFGFARETKEASAEPEPKSWIGKMFSAIGSFVLGKPVEKSFQEELNKQITNPMFIMHVFEEDFFKSYFNSTSSEDDLVALRDAMVSATEYINGVLLTVSKSDATNTTTDTPSENDTVAVEDACGKKKKQAAEDGCEDEEMTAEQVKKMLDDFKVEILAEVTNQVAKSAQEPVDVEAVVKTAIEGLVTQFNSIEERVATVETGSKASAEHESAPVVKTQIKVQRAF